MKRARGGSCLLPLGTFIVLHKPGSCVLPSPIIVGVSGQATRPGTVPVPSDPVFETVQTGNNPRTFDAENKILENLAKQLGPDSKGVVYLHSELDICVSCSGVISQFQQKFPNITVIITTGRP